MTRFMRVCAALFVCLFASGLFAGGDEIVPRALVKNQNGEYFVVVSVNGEKVVVRPIDAAKLNMKRDQVLPAASLTRVTELPRDSKWFAFNLVTGLVIYSAI